jgi:hypothetical protein
MSCTEHEPIILVGGGFGPFLADADKTGYRNDPSNTGAYFGVRAGNYAAGFGLSLPTIDGLIPDVPASLGVIMGAPLSGRTWCGTIDSALMRQEPAESGGVCDAIGGR